MEDLFKNEPSAPSAKPNIKPLVQDLIEDAESPINYETAYRFLKDQNGQYTNEWVTPNTNSGSIIPIKAGGNAYGGAHIHTNWLFPMYLWSDVFVLYNMFKYGDSHVRNEVVYLLVTKECLTCSQVKVYALKIDNFISFRAKIISDMNNPETIGFTDEQKVRYANRKFQEKFNNETNYERMFLEYFADHNISMYKANEDLTDWSKLSLSGSSIQSITEIPCN